VLTLNPSLSQHDCNTIILFTIYSQYKISVYVNRIQSLLYTPTIRFRRTEIEREKRRRRVSCSPVTVLSYLVLSVLRRWWNVRRVTVQCVDKMSVFSSPGFDVPVVHRPTRRTFRRLDDADAWSVVDVGARSVEPSLVESAPPDLPSSRCRRPQVDALRRNDEL
jgi:hypothetical protein